MEPSSSTVFVGQVPRDMAEQDLQTFMEECGRIVHINMLTDRSTGQFKGCAFVTFETTEGANLAKETMHDKQRLPGASHPVQVTTARSKSGPGAGHGGGHHSGAHGGNAHGMSGEGRSSTHQPRRKLFVGMLSRSLTDEDLRQMFLPYGDVEDCIILRTTDKSSKGCAFVTMLDMQCCQKAIVALHNSQTFPGCSGPVVVKFADTPEQKENRRGPHMPSGGAGIMGMGMPPHLHMPPGMPPHQAMQAAAAGYGHHQMPPPSMAPVAPSPDMSGMSGLQSLLAPTMAQLVKQQQELQQQQRTINQALQMLGIPAAGGARAGEYSLPASSDSSAYRLPAPAAHGAAAGAVMPSYEQPAAQAGGGTGPGGYRTGPEGANLFIYHLASNTTDSELHQLFSAYGQVVSARVYCDRATGQSKGFGFVSYDNPESAQGAIQGLHGFQMSGRRLKVQLKKGREGARPY